jgi:hypothetical protein
VSFDALREANKRIKLLEQEKWVICRAAAYLSQAQLPGNDVPALSARWPSMGFPSQ